MSKLFYVGQAVICINDDFSYARSKYPDPTIQWPRFAQRYVIRAYIIGGKYPAVALQEIRNPNVIYYDGIMREAGFWDRRFVAAPPPAKKEAIREREEELA